MSLNIIQMSLNIPLNDLNIIQNEFEFQLNSHSWNTYYKNKFDFPDWRRLPRGHHDPEDTSLDLLDRGALWEVVIKYLISIGLLPLIGLSADFFLFVISADFVISANCVISVIYSDIVSF